MRIIVLSDSHGDTFDLLRAIDAEPTAKYAFFLGDGATEAQDAASVYSGRMEFRCVRGNCDFGSSLPDFETAIVENVKIYITHGYKEQVKFGLSSLACEARGFGASIAVFGHTHQQYYEYDDGLHLFNPGSIRECRYGVIDITPAGIVCVSKHLVF